MDTLTEELKKNGVYATSHSHTEWKAVADRAAADYKAKKEGPMILIGHSLGADAVMEMADYLGDKGVAVALCRSTAHNHFRSQPMLLGLSISRSEITLT